MSWEDHVVECKNKDGEVGKFVYAKHASENSEWKGVPFLKGNWPGRDSIFMKESDDKWRHATQGPWVNRGWDLRPLEMHEDKPFEKAFLGYHAETDEYAWFIKASDSPIRNKSNKIPYKMNWYPNAIWNLSSNTHSMNWENKGWVFSDSKKEEKVSEYVEVLQQKLVEYCCAKSTRGTHLVKLTQLGALNNTATYDEVAKIVRDYLNTESSVCTEGADRAIKALGLAPKKFVVCELTRYEITKHQARTNKYPHFVGDKDSDLGEFDVNQVKNFPSNALMKVGYYE